MKPIIFGACALVALSSASAQVAGQVSKVSAKACYVRANHSEKPRLLERSMNISVGEEVFCPLDASIEVDLVNGQTRRYEPQWMIVGGVPALGKPPAPGYKSHIESASVESQSRAVGVSDKAGKKRSDEFDAKTTADLPEKSGVDRAK